jgi:uncharacterized protein (TIGR02466 family)
MPDDVMLFYPTTVLRRHLDGMEDNNRQLAALITGIQSHEPNASAGTSTKGGFQTREDFLSSEHPHSNNPALLALKRHIADAISTYSEILIRQECAHMPRTIDTKIWGWAVSLKAGNWQAHHVHSGADISGVYYIAAPPIALNPDSDNGKIIFHDPRPRANMSQLLTQITQRQERPVPGDMILFPSWLEHSVPPFEGEGARIGIAFNVKLTLA